MPAHREYRALRGFDRGGGLETVRHDTSPRGPIILGRGLCFGEGRAQGHDGELSILSDMHAAVSCMRVDTRGPQRGHRRGAGPGARCGSRLEHRTGRLLACVSESRTRRLVAPAIAAASARGCRRPRAGWPPSTATIWWSIRQGRAYVGNFGFDLYNGARTETGRGGPGSSRTGAPASSPTIHVPQWHGHHAGRPNHDHRRIVRGAAHRLRRAARRLADEPTRVGDARRRGAGRDLSRRRGRHLGRLAAQPRGPARARGRRGDAPVRVEKQAFACMLGGPRAAPCSSAPPATAIPRRVAPRATGASRWSTSTYRRRPAVGAAREDSPQRRGGSESESFRVAVPRDEDVLIRAGRRGAWRRASGAAGAEDLDDGSSTSSYSSAERTAHGGVHLVQADDVGELEDLLVGEASARRAAKVASASGRPRSTSASV